MRQLAALMFLLSAPALAENTDWYTVEMIVFERTSGLGDLSESWPADPGLPELSESVALSSSYSVGAQGPTSFRLLGPRERKLGGIYRRLTAQPYLRPLLHMAWRQPGYERENVKTVHITSNESPGIPGLDPVYGIEGAASLYRSRYLHLLMDLRYYRPDPSATQAMPPEREAAVPGEELPGAAVGFPDEPAQSTPMEAVPIYFRLAESRRMRSGELHYFDHPLFGAIVQVRPYEKAGAGSSGG